MSDSASETIISPHDPEEIRCARIDFPLQAGIKEYEGHFATVIDNAFSPEECNSLLRLAELISSAELENRAYEKHGADKSGKPIDPWVPAAVYSISSGEEQIVRPTYRNSGRIVVDDSLVAESIFRRLQPYLEEVGELGPFYSAGLLANRPNQDRGNIKKEKPLWRLKGINERLRFLKYEPGQFFKPHCDAVYIDPRTRATSFVTVQIYLSPEQVKGGATRFWSTDKTRYYDVEPRLGRALIFQQAGLKHSGEEVEDGVKYTVRTEFMYERTEEGERMERRMKEGNRETPTWIWPALRYLLYTYVVWRLVWWITLDFPHFW